MTDILGGGVPQTGTCYYHPPPPQKKLDSCASSVDQKQYTIAVFLDLSKAFGNVIEVRAAWI